MSQRFQAFDQLIADAHACRTCPRMCDSVRVLSWANGDPQAPLMFIGEAPGRHGANRTAIPFHGDKAGDNFERLLGLAGLNRSQVFVTNAVLCNPRDEKGNNAPPNQTEIDNCAAFLRSQIEVIQPLMVMTLGSVALEATRRIEPHELTLRTSVRTACSWFGRILLPLYHPGARAMIHRSFPNQTADYYFVGETFRRLTKKRRKLSSKVRGSVSEWEIVRHVVQANGSISNFRLHKLMYLLDVKAMEKLGTRVTSFLYLRQKDGPYCVELGSRWYQRFSAEIAVRKADKHLRFEYRATGFFDPGKPDAVGEDIAGLIAEVCESTRRLTDAQLKTRAYLTSPMKRVLRAEKAGSTMINRPLLPLAA